MLGWFITDEAHENGVVDHERQAFNTGGLRAGLVVVEASYLRWEDNQPVTQEQLSIEIVSGGGSQPGAGGGGDGGGDLCTGGGMQRIAALECP